VTRIVIDIETRSEVDVRSVGSYRYGGDPSTEVTVTGYAVDDEPVKLIPGIVGEGGIEGILSQVKEDGTPYVLPEQLSTWDELIGHLEKPDLVLCAHNIEFESSVLAYRYWKPEGWFDARWSDTAARCRNAGYPGALEKALEALLSPIPKDMEVGRKAMLRTSRVRAAWKKNGSGAKYFEDSETLAKLYAYNVTDVEGQRWLDKLLPELEGF